MVLLEAMNLFHAIGIAWGVGGVTIAIILMMKAEKNPESASHIMKLMPSISKLIWLGFLLLVISGIGLASLVTWPVDRTILLVKHLVVALLFIHGIYMTFGIIKKMNKLAPIDGPPSEEFLKLKKMFKISGIIGLVLWYLIVILSVVM